MRLIEPAISLFLKNILLATDLTPASEKALKYARALAKKHGSQLHAIHVGGEYSYQLLEPEPLDITFRELPDAAQHPTDALRKLFQGLPTQVPLRHGAIWELISEVISRREIDLVVLGTHGRKGLDRMLFGSIAEDVLRNVACPVLTVGPDVKFDDVQELKIARIMLATDFDAHSSAPAYAAWLANDFHAALTVVHAIHDKTQEQIKAVNPEELNLYAHPDIPPARHWQPELPTEKQFASLFPEGIQPWGKLQCMVEFGLPAEAILGAAARVRPDLIVLGARHPEPARLNSHLLWPTAAKVIADAPCPVLTVGPQQEIG